MTFTVIDVDQRSEEWFTARLGRLTGSRAADMTATYKDGKTPAAAQRNLLTQLALERVTGHPVGGNNFQSAAMLQGIEREPDALVLYETIAGRVVQTCGFLSSVGVRAGCSLDGYVGDFEGIVEAKSPIPATHLEYLRTGKVPTDYLLQVTHNLWVSGAAWCDWISYNPDFPEALQSKLVRIERDEKVINDYQAVAMDFLARVDKLVDEVQAMVTAEMYV